MARDKCRHVATCRVSSHVSDSRAFATIVTLRRATYDWQSCLKRSLRMGVADMNDHDSDWISLGEAATLVEATMKCYRDKAIDLLRQAADDLKLKSRTVTSSSPRWVVSDISGEERIYSDWGKRIEVSRKGVLELCAELQKDAAASTLSGIGSGAISDGIRLAIDDLWTDEIPKGLRAKDRNKKILEWLKDHKKSIPTDLSKAVQRVLRRARNTS
jgi:hypothetical protein